MKKVFFAAILLAGQVQSQGFSSNYPYNKKQNCCSKDGSPAITVVKAPRSIVIKKDGTTDKRFKGAATLKKDCNPDKRFVVKEKS